MTLVVGAMTMMAVMMMTMVRPVFKEEAKVIVNRCKIEARRVEHR